MVRLVFRPFSKVSRSICTSEPLASFHQGFPWLHPTLEKFTIFRVPTYMLQLKSFAKAHDRPMLNNFLCTPALLSLRVRVLHPNTRTHVRLLDPCFKTGCLQPFRLGHHSAESPKESTTVAPQSVLGRSA